MKDGNNLWVGLGDGFRDFCWRMMLTQGDEWWKLEGMCLQWRRVAACWWVMAHAMEGVVDLFGALDVL